MKWVTRFYFLYAASSFGFITGKIFLIENIFDWVSSMPVTSALSSSQMEDIHKLGENNFDFIDKNERNPYKKNWSSIVYGQDKGVVKINN